MGLRDYEFINNTKVSKDKMTPPKKEETTVVELPNDEVLITLADRAPETINILRVYDLSCYRRKAKPRMDLPQEKAEIDKLIFAIRDMANGRSIKGDGTFVRIEKL